ncbi:MAG: hypothetical protein F6K28_28875 [Microcoleus sp. SIO2G3]|nr:hypothetical protein [Microcoleus sp. SIO2G3]
MNLPDAADRLCINKLDRDSGKMTVVLLRQGKFHADANLVCNLRWYSAVKRSKQTLSVAIEAAASVLSWSSAYRLAVSGQSRQEVA